MRGWSRIDVTIYVGVSFQQRDWVDDKLRNIDRFYRPAVTSAPCNILNRKTSWNWHKVTLYERKIIYRVCKNVSCFKHSKEKDTLQLHKAQKDFELKIMMLLLLLLVLRIMPLIYLLLIHVYSEDSLQLKSWKCFWKILGNSHVG